MNRRNKELNINWLDMWLNGDIGYAIIAPYVCFRD